MKNVRRGRQPFVDAVVIVCAISALAIPVDFVNLNPFWRQVSTVTLIVGAVVSVIAVVKRRSRAANVALLVVVLLILFNQFVAYNPVGFVTILGPFAIGLAASFSVKRPLEAMAGLGAVNALLLVYEWINRRHVISYFFGLPFQEFVGDGEFRARGLAGQPVPAAMIAVVLCFGAIVYPGAGRRVIVLKWIAVISALAALAATGTRSALLLAVAGIVLLVFLRFIQKHTNVSRTVVIWVPLGGAIFLLSLPYLMRVVSDWRVADFQTLAGSASVNNREYATEVFSVWSDACNGPCVFFGSGARNLLQTLSSGLGLSGFSTVDNIFLSFLWDFGFLGILALLLVAMFAIMHLRASAGGASLSGALIVILSLASGLSYDSLYIRSALVVFGFGVGLMAAAKNINSAAGLSSSVLNSRVTVPAVHDGSATSARGVPNERERGR